MDQRIIEFHNILPLENLASVLEHGLLSNKGAKKRSRQSIAEPAVQDRRSRNKVPRGLALHEYANLYFDARNPMMYVRKDQASEICVLAFSRKVLALDGVVVTDGNAAASWTKFFEPSKLDELPLDDIFARYWCR